MTLHGYSVPEPEKHEEAEEIVGVLDLPIFPNSNQILYPNQLSSFISYTWYMSRANIVSINIQNKLRRGRKNKIKNIKNKKSAIMSLAPNQANANPRP